MPSLSFLSRVQMCMRVEFHHRKNGLFGLLRALHEVACAFAVTSSSIVSMRFLVSGPVLVDLLRAVWVRKGVNHAARPEPLPQLRVLEVVGVLGLVLGVEVVERAEELFESVRGRQVLVAVPQVVLAELAGHVALRLEQLGDRHVLLLQAFLGARQADLERPGAERRLAGDECRPARRCSSAGRTNR